MHDLYLVYSSNRYSEIFELGFCIVGELVDLLGIRILYSRVER